MTRQMYIHECAYEHAHLRTDLCQWTTVKEKQ